jgi:hypothetical protein
MEDCEAMVGSQINEKQVVSVRTALIAVNHFRQRNHWGKFVEAPMVATGK